MGMRLTGVCLLSLVSLRMGGADRIPDGPEGRGPFDARDSFVLPDGRVYTPGDACTDGIYGETLRLVCSYSHGWGSYGLGGFLVRSRGKLFQKLFGVVPHNTLMSWCRSAEEGSLLHVKGK